MNSTAIDTRLKIQNILFATDFSKASAHAVPYVRSLSKHYQSKVVALHIRPPVINPMTQSSTWDADIQIAQAIDEEHRKDLLETFASIPAQVIIEEGPLELCFDDAIREYKIDLLVLGTRGRTGMGKLLLGSVAEEMFRRAKCPVLTVGPNTEYGRRGPGKFERILCATDLGPTSSTTAAYAFSLAREFQAHCTLLHVIPPQPVCDYHFDVPSYVNKRLLDLIPAGAEADGKPQIIVEHGVPGRTILEIGDQLDADLIVLGCHSEEGVPGAASHLPIATAHRVVAQAGCPVLTIRS